MNRKYLAIVTILVIGLVIISLTATRHSSHIIASPARNILTYTPQLDRNTELQNDKTLATLLFSNLPESEEIPERLSAHDYIESTDKVLELGGNVGGVSVIIASILSSGKNLVVVEPSKRPLIQLNNLKDLYGFHVYHGIITKPGVNIACKETDDSEAYSVCSSVDYKVDGNITYENIQKLYNITFDTLVIDCEGCYADFLNYGIEDGWIINIKKIIIEWDGTFMQDILLSLGFRLISTRYHSNVPHGVRVYIR